MTRPETGDVALWAFLDELKTRLMAIRDDQKSLRFSLRLTCEYFKASDGCIATLFPSASRAAIACVVPRRSEWDLDLIAAFLRKQRPAIPAGTIMAPLNRRGRLWAVLALRGDREFDRADRRALMRIARMISESLQAMDWQRIVEVRSRIDRKIMEQLRPQDLFYQILHGLRSLTRYDHSSALLICDPRGNTLDLVAEQI